LKFHSPVPLSFATTRQAMNSKDYDLGPVTPGLTLKESLVATNGNSESWRVPAIFMYSRRKLEGK